MSAQIPSASQNARRRGMAATCRGHLRGRAADCGCWRYFYPRGRRRALDARDGWMPRLERNGTHATDRERSDQWRPLRVKDGEYRRLPPIFMGSGTGRRPARTAGAREAVLERSGRRTAEGRPRSAWPRGGRPRTRTPTAAAQDGRPTAETPASGAADRAQRDAPRVCGDFFSNRGSDEDGRVGRDLAADRGRPKSVSRPRER